MLVILGYTRHDLPIFSQRSLKYTSGTERLGKEVCINDVTPLRGGVEDFLSTIYYNTYYNRICAKGQCVKKY